VLFTFPFTFGWSLCVQGKSERGLTVLTQATNIAPTNMNTPMRLATTLMAAGDKAVSHDALEAVLRLGANSPLIGEA